MFSVLLGIYPGMELMTHMVTFKGTAKPFSEAAILFQSDYQCMRIAIFSHPHQRLLLLPVFVFAILVGVKWCLNVASMSISLCLLNLKTFCKED